MELWKRSEAFALVGAFIMAVNEKIKGTSRDTPRAPSPKVKLILDHLSWMIALVAEIPPLQQAMRFGNKAFRIWHEKMMQRAPAFMSELVGAELTEAGAPEELLAYFEMSFGHPQRIDFGTGHELNFVAWLTALQALGVLTSEDLLCVALDVIERYLDLCRLLQRTYWLEPAGSKGAWGLDEYQFLPFLWGAAQLIDHPELKPSSVLDPATVARYADKYMYMGCIKFVCEVKTGPFREHSAILYTISELPNWQKANAGLIRMYEGEVLSKFPIIQHFPFGTILPFTTATVLKQRVQQQQGGPNPASASSSSSSSGPAS